MGITEEKKKEYLTKKLGRPGLTIQAVRETRKLVKYSFYADFEGLQSVILYPILVVGFMGSGKTTLINYLIRIIKNLYKKQSQQVLFTNSLQYNMQNIADRDVIILVTDDAVELQDSTSFISSRSKKTAHDYFKLRHLYEQKFDRNKGILFTIMGTQLYKSLDNRLRQARMIFFKNTLLDKEKNQYMAYHIGWESWKWLDKVTDWLYSMNPEFAKYFVLKKGNLVRRGSFPFVKQQYKCKYVNASSNVQDEKLLTLTKVLALRARGKKWKEIQKILGEQEENENTFRNRFNNQLARFIRDFNLLEEKM
ncbi:MAG: hypothetical protein JRJ62_12010 [Deltaproteobacteria bacterium]|nr:hypothetical protein [Deltaproteobacteria bacterium]